MVAAGGADTMFGGAAFGTIGLGVRGTGISFGGHASVAERVTHREIIAGSAMRRCGGGDGLFRRGRHGRLGKSRRREQKGTNKQKPC